ncbi:otolin-1 [Centroberyx affinis]|uniref:otolin-1 n=1 Tax=Centroberyx affinis TaxID=166261 RepID=UPI003A5C5E4B
MSSEEQCELMMSGPDPPPANQLPWYCICHQCKGNQGTKGDPGDRGLPGIPGSPGRRGTTGFRGQPGFVGRQGIKGQKGEEGLKGERGVEGFVGPKGAGGFKGEKGDRGGEGRPGDQGIKGNDGLCPESCEATKGDPGPQGLSGAAGPRGDAGLQGSKGDKGVKGDTGSMGTAGNPGSVGEKGDQGAQGECDCHDGEKGGSGEKGDKGDQGGEGDTGSMGVKGSQGEKGDLGPVGIMGPPGPCMPIVQSAFSAGLAESFPPPNTPVLFTQILNNVQGHYDPATGIYTAPIDGTYIFSYHLSVFQRVLKVGIFLNFQPIVKTTSTTELGTTAHEVILHLSRGDRVWVMVKDEITNGMHAGRETASTFSGFLLHPDRCDMALPRGPPPTKAPGEYIWSPPNTTTTVTPPTKN